MKTLGLFLLSIKEYLILSLLIVISLILIFSNDNSQVRFLRAVGVGFVGAIQSGMSAVPNVFEIEKKMNSSVKRTLSFRMKYQR